jgi:tRNA (cytidine/uridine-2'-O-)-methyltransferase
VRVVLYEPEIPPNTGNIARLCAATDCELHLVEPLGFSIDDKHLKRAGLDYWPHVRLFVHRDWPAFLNARARQADPGRLVLAGARQGTPLHRFCFQAGDWLVLGPETRGLPDELYAAHPDHVRIPMRGRAVRSLNLSTAAGVLLWEALRQTGGFDGL